MQQLRTFFRTIAHSLVNPMYYADVLRANLSFSLKYFIVLNFFLAMFSLVRVVVPLYQFDLARVVDEGLAVIPRDLVVTSKENRLSINKPTPYSIPLPGGMGPVSDGDPGSFEIENLITYETDANISGVRDIKNYKSLMVVTESTLYAVEETDTFQVRAYPFPEDMEDFTLDYGTVLAVKNQILGSPFFAQKLYVPMIAGILLFLLFPALLLWRLMTVAIYSLFLFFVALLFKNAFFRGHKFPYEKVFQVGLHSMTLSLFLAYFADFTGYGHWMQGLLYFMVFAVWTLFVMSTAVSQGKAANSASSAAPKVVSSKAVSQKATTRTRKKTTKK